MSRFYHHTQGRLGKLKLAATKMVKDADDIYYEVKGLKIEFVSAWPTGRGSEVSFTNPASGLTEMTQPPTPPGPEFVNLDSLTPASVLSLEEFEGRVIGMKKESFAGKTYEEKLDLLEQWFDSSYAQRKYGFMKGDPRGKRPVTMTMTADEYADLRVGKATKQTKKLPELPPEPETSAPGAQKVMRGTRTAPSGK